MVKREAKTSGLYAGKINLILIDMEKTLCELDLRGGLSGKLNEDMVNQQRISAKKLSGCM